MTLMSPSASTDSERKKPKVDSEPTPIVVDGVGDTVVSENVDVHVLSTDDGPIDDLALKGDDVSKIDPYFGHNDEADGIRDTRKGEE